MDACDSERGRERSYERRGVAEACVHQRPGIDPTAGLLVVVTALLCALAAGSALFLLLPTAL